MLKRSNNQGNLANLKTLYNPLKAEKRKKTFHCQIKQTNWYLNDDDDYF